VIFIKTNTVFDPKLIVSAILAAVVEVAIIASLIFVINASPFEVKKEEYITINLNMMENKQVKEQEIVEQPKPEPVKPVETQPEEQKKQPDALFEALKTFQQQPTQKVEGVTSGLKTIETPLIKTTKPDSIFEQNTLDFNQVQSAPAKRKINSALLFSEKSTSLNSSSADPNYIYNLNELQQFDIPNLDSVKNALVEDYQQLLKGKNIRPETVSGNVSVELRLDKSSKTTVTIITAVSPELANLVVKNLKLLYLSENLNPLTIKVNVGFSAK
jgi:hypothetical protein